MLLNNRLALGLLSNRFVSEDQRQHGFPEFDRHFHSWTLDLGGWESKSIVDEGWGINVVWRELALSQLLF